MRIRISYETKIAYAQPSRSTIVHLRLTPRSFDTQYVLRWRVSVDLDCALRQSKDAFGNIVHSFSYQRPVESIAITAAGEIETTDAIGVVRGAEEPLPYAMYLRESPKASVTAKLREFVAANVEGAGDTLDRLHRLMGAIHSEIALDAESGDLPGGATEALALKRGSAADMALVFIAAARSLEIPARLATGFFAREDDEQPSELDVWAEAHTPGLGWVAFDCVRDLCPNDRYVRMALGFDPAGAEPIRASHSGGGAESKESLIRIQASSAQAQTMNQ